MAATRTQPAPIELPACGVIALESHHAEGFTMAASSHAFWEVFFVLAGRGVFRLGEREETCTPGHLILVPPGVAHCIQDAPGAPLSLSVLGIRADLVALDPDAARLPAGRLELTEGAVTQVRREWRRLWFDQTRPLPGAAALRVARALRLLGLLVRGQLMAEERGLTSTGRVRRYLAELEQRFFEVGSIDDEATRAGLSRRRFTQLVREQTGETWHERVTRLRMNHAQHLLATTRRSVTSIAFECGYDELSSFYRSFRRQMDMTPTEFREGSGLG